MCIRHLRQIKLNPPTNRPTNAHQIAPHTALINYVIYSIKIYIIYYNVLISCRHFQCMEFFGEAIQFFGLYVGFIKSYSFFSCLSKSNLPTTIQSVSTSIDDFILLSIVWSSKWTDEIENRLKIELNKTWNTTHHTHKLKDHELTFFRNIITVTHEIFELPLFLDTQPTNQPKCRDSNTFFTKTNFK